MPFKYPVVLSIAGSDSGGGAGIQADLKTISALGCYGATALTAVTVQNTLGISAIHALPAEIVTAQIKAVMDDLKPAAIKIGMLYSAEIATAVAETLAAYPGIPIIFDPVMAASSGDSLGANNLPAVFKKALYPLAMLITPNLKEAALLTGMPVNTLADMKTAATQMLSDGCNAVLIKGGHLTGAKLFDVYLDKKGIKLIFPSKAIDSNNTHGTGCTLSSAIAAWLALGEDMLSAIEKGKRFVHQAIEQGKDVKTGEGHGPLNHFFAPKEMVKLNLL